MKVNQEKMKRLIGINTPEMKTLKEKYNNYDRKELINVIRQTTAKNREYVGLLKEVARLNVECCNWIYSPSLSARIDKAIEKAEGETDILYEHLSTLEDLEKAEGVE